MDGDPWAYAILCRPGEEFDYLVFPDLENATHERDARCDELGEGETEPVVIPLYPADCATKARLAAAEEVCKAFDAVRGGLMPSQQSSEYATQRYKDLWHELLQVYGKYSRQRKAAADEHRR